MTPSEIRRALLREHDDLRASIDETRDAASRADNGPAEFEDLRDRLRHLVDKLVQHNRHEEDLLLGVLRTADAWGPLREEVMNAHHAVEHRQFVGALLEASAIREVDTFRAIVLPAIDRLLDHMAHEERMFLSEDVLRDDAVVIDQSSG